MVRDVTYYLLLNDNEQYFDLQIFRKNHMNETKLSFDRNNAMK